MEKPSKEFEFDSGCLRDLLPIYYKKFFPNIEFHRWLNYGREKTNHYFSSREFSFTLNGDIYLRYKSFEDADALRKSLIDNAPHKIDIGAVYDGNMNSADFKPVEREFVIDIDMNDYDDVRKCCDGAKICTDCWLFMVIAMDVLDTALREDFGYNHILWVFSGRRGIHAWVCDRRARLLARHDREALIRYLSLLGKLSQTSRVDPNVDTEHPFVKRVIKTLEKYADDMFIERQKWATTDEFWTNVLNLVQRDVSEKGDSSAKSELQRRLESYPLGEQRWRAFKDILQKFKGKFKRFNTLYAEVLLSYLYPRLDAHVSTTLNHLLKAPYSVHPKTGRISVPITGPDFDPFQVPTIQQLCNEEATLKPYNDVFTQFINAHFRAVKKNTVNMSF